jgi:integrase
MRTIFTKKTGESVVVPKVSPNIPDPLENENGQHVNFPKRLRHRGKGRVLVTIYKRPGSYRVYWRARVYGKPVSRFKDFPNYTESRREADKLAAALARGSSSPALSPGQASDALAALQRLQRFYEDTGKRPSLLQSISEYCDAAAKLNGRSLGEAIDGYLSTVANVQRRDVAQAVEDFIGSEDPRTKALNGQRAQLSSKYHYNRAIMLRRFAAAFPGHAVVDLAKAHLDAFINGLAENKSKSRNGKPVSSPKGRNHHRAAIRQFLQWAVRKDYLVANHRLVEADAMRPENANNSQIEFYTPHELNALLNAAEGSMRAMIAIGGLAGLRTQELLRLDWADVWRVRGHVEVTAAKSKTRQRRLVEVGPALRAWIAPFRQLKVGQVCTLHEITWQQHFVKLCEDTGVVRKPNGLRHSFCSYAFALKGEVWTAQQAGHAPNLLHAHYRGLTTAAEARKWFAVKPVRPTNIICVAPSVSSQRA